MRVGDLAVIQILEGNLMIICTVDTYNLRDELPKRPVVRDNISSDVQYRKKGRRRWRLTLKFKNT